MTDEVWKPIPSHPRYMVSNYGRVRGLRGTFIGNMTSYGYVKVLLYENGVSEERKVCQLVLELFGDPKPFEGAVTRHLDGNPVNDHIGNLTWGTHLENTDDRRAHGRDFNGERNPSSKLTEVEVSEIRDMIDAGDIPQVEIAELFGVTKAMISHIKYGRAWTH